MASRGYDYYIRCKITVTSQVVHNKNIITMATSTLYSSAQLKYITFSYNIIYRTSTCILNSLVTNSLNDQRPVAPVAMLEQHCTSIPRLGLKACSILNCFTTAYK